MIKWKKFRDGSEVGIIRQKLSNKYEFKNFKSHKSRQKQMRNFIRDEIGKTMTLEIVFNKFISELDTAKKRIA